MQVKGPKTTTSIRQISIPQSPINLLREYKKWQMNEKMRLANVWQKEAKASCEQKNEKWIDPGWVFTTWDGYNIFPDSLTGIFKKFLKRHDLPDIRLHDLRHTSCTLLIHAGLNVRAVASRMGHANPNVTLAVYSHALQSADRQASDMMENLLNPKLKNQVKKQA